MSEMTERVARAICPAAGRDPDKIHSPAVGVELPWWRIYEHQAVAAISALREPPPGFLCAAGTAHGECIHGPDLTWKIGIALSLGVDPDRVLDEALRD